MRGLTPAAPPIRGNVAGVAWPALTVGRAGTIANLVDQLDSTQWLPPAAVTAAQFGQLRLLARALATTSPAFRQRLVGAGLRPEDLGTPAGLAHLPPLARDRVAAGGELFATSVPREHAPVVDAKTSGSTGPPVTVRRTAMTSLVWDALTIRDHLWRGIDFRGRVLANRFTLSDSVDLPDWGPPVSSLFDSGPLRAVPIGPIEAFAAEILAFRPDVVLLRPSVLDALLAHRARTGADDPAPSYVHTYGEPLAPVLRAEAVAWGATVWDTYSCEEVGNMAATCPDGDAYHVLEGVLVEVLDEHGRACATGEVGRVVVTDLHNLATPLVRYELGDYAEVVPPCACGRGLPTLGRVVGRERNRVRLPDGRWHWPSFATLTRYQEVAPVRQMQLVQRPDGGVDVRGVAATAEPRIHEAALTPLLHDALGDELPLRFVWSEAPLARTAGGKHEPFRRQDGRP